MGRAMGVVGVSLAAAWFGACAHEPPKVAPPPLVQAELTPDEQFVARSVKDLVVHFDFDSSYLTFENRETLMRVAEVMRARPAVTIRISGHCDEVGTEEYNLLLGQRRAEGALRYLEALGVSSDHLKTISFGKERPVDVGSDADSRAKNRRDEFEVFQESPAEVAER